MERREFLKWTAMLTGGVAFLRSPLAWGIEKDFPVLALAKDASPKELVRKVIEKLGGMSRFVKPGDIVVVKPNVSWDRLPDQAATTHPEVVREVVTLCFEAGAKQVKVFDYTLNEPRRCYKRTGIQSAAESAGANVLFISERKFKKVPFPEGELIREWEVYEDALQADKIINVPIAKHHSISGVSLGMKNLMGLIGGNRGQFHRQFSKKIVDLSTRIRPHLVVLDAYRMLVRNGPSGGSLSDVVQKRMVIAGTDPVAVDSYGASLFGLSPDQVPFLVEAKARGLGENNLKKISTAIVS